MLEPGFDFLLSDDPFFSMSVEIPNDDAKELDFSDVSTSSTIDVVSTPNSPILDIGEKTTQYQVEPADPCHSFAPIPVAALSRAVATPRGGSRKRKDPDLSAIVDEEERKRAQRKIRNKEAAQNSRDRVKCHIIQLESSLHTMSYANVTLQQQLQLQITENGCLRERLRQAELLLQQNNIDTGLLVQADAPAPSITSMLSNTHAGNHTLPLYNVNPAKLRYDKGPLASGFMTFSLLFTFVFAFQFPGLPSALQFTDSHGDRLPVSALRPSTSVGRLLESEL